MQFNEYCRTLDVKLSASAHEIKQSYRRLARKYHPDLSTQLNSDNLFREISEAYAGLKNAYRNSISRQWKEPIKRITLRH